MGASKEAFFQIRVEQQLDHEAIERGRTAVTGNTGEWQQLARSRQDKIKQYEQSVFELIKLFKQAHDLHAAAFNREDKLVKLHIRKAYCTALGQFGITGKQALQIAEEHGL